MESDSPRSPATPTQPRASIVIPAHNEAAVLPRTLAAILDGAEPGEFEIVVACNGCTDDSAEVARRFAGVRVVDVATPSKAAALNAGDAAAQAFPRIYLDADVSVSTDVLRGLVTVLTTDQPCAGAPAIHLDLSRRSWAIRAYYAIWEQVAWAVPPVLGSGLYGLSEQGRRRFESFPILVADDYFISQVFPTADRRAAPGSFTVLPPTTLRALVNRRVRVHAGNLQYQRAAQRAPESFPARHDADHGGLRAAARRPRGWPGLAVYLAVNSIAKARANARVRFGNMTKWDKDETSRQL